ncbi:FG-GAP-like repeat-containing protein [Leptolyngbya ohadii]|uniref:FG-GAP-like repeat-containing protein n=1 Tax=Leptolyngbya ohadii TaxID=1962290 RepID=UPI000B59A0CC|nr:FG-GAP-like repeat-containing protein [Leptolyngbya ohadii]
MAIGTNPFSLQFDNATQFATDDNPLDITTGDFNGDGILDLATANSDSDNVSVLLGAGNGTFSAGSVFAAGDEPYAVTTADFNADGRLDLAVANRLSNNVSLLLGTGTGSFTAGGTLTVATRPISVVTGDFNGDTRPDLATVGSNENLVTVLLNGAGGFGIPTNFSIGINPTSLITADFNGDGKLDIATTNAATDSPSPTGVNTIAVALGSGTGSFLNPTPFGAGVDPYALTVGDFNNDGKLDIATANFGSNNASLLLGNGTGGFETARTIALTAGSIQPYSIANGDMNGDGKLDLIVANSGSNTVNVLLGDGIGGFTAAAPLATGNRSEPNGLAIGDFNRDGKPDVATATFSTDRAAVFLNRTTLISLNDGTKTIDASLERTASITTDLTAGTLTLNSTPPANTNVSNYLNVVGTDLNDTLGGNSQANILDGKGGNDAINALDGNDTLTGGAGNDSLNGGDGDDRYLFTANTPLGSDTITDPEGIDTLDFSASTQPIAVNLGVTAAQNVNGNLTLTLVAANQLDNVTGGSGNDRINGNALDNTLLGGTGDDFLNGQAGDDNLLGEAGNDNLVGAVGDDDLTGGMGNDSLRGGNGEDNFVFDIGKAFTKAEMGVDTLRDFNRNFDRITLDRTTFTELGRRVSFASVDRLLQAKRSDAVITYIRGTGNLYYNANGSERGFGEGGLFATLERSTSPARNLSAADFAIRR